MSGASDARAAAGRPSVARCAALALLGIASFELSAAALRAVTPWPEEYGLRAKRDWFVERKDEYDVLFVGASRTFRGIDPRIVDEELARVGLTGAHGPLRSFNFGVGGMLRFESDYVIDALLAERPRRLRAVVVEGDPWEPTTDFLQNTWSSRTIAWHDWERTRLALRSVALLEAPPQERLSIGWTHLQQFGMRLHNLGQGRRLAAEILGESRDPFQRSLTAAQIGVAAGYQPYEDFLPPGPTTWQQSLLADPGRADAIRARVQAGNERPARLDRYNLAALAAQEQRVARAGALLVVLIMPGDQGAPEERAIALRDERHHLLDHNRPDLEPRWWDADARIDDLHLSRTAAVELSKTVAAELARILRPGG
ncbi:MAG: hypothetical protein JNK02_10915 [Planctomycetes bacterium]|nr:hypothetical protein [Planctomycetota bacterium]